MKKQRKAIDCYSAESRHIGAKDWSTAVAVVFILVSFASVTATPTVCNDIAGGAAKRMDVENLRQQWSSDRCEICALKVDGKSSLAMLGCPNSAHEKVDYRHK